MKLLISLKLLLPLRGSALDRRPLIGTGSESVDDITPTEMTGDDRLHQATPGVDLHDGVRLREFGGHVRERDPVPEGRADCPARDLADDFPPRDDVGAGAAPSPRPPSDALTHVGVVSTIAPSRASHPTPTSNGAAPPPPATPGVLRPWRAAAAAAPRAACRR